MKKKQMKASLLLASLLTLGFSVTGCTNDDYDFDQIDATMGFGSGELEIPASSTMNIPLSDVPIDRFWCIICFTNDFSYCSEG